MAEDHHANRTLVLASRSPRRAQMLRQAGYRFTQAAPPFDDPPQPQSDGRSPQELAAELAGLKARSFHDHREPGQVILAADTICVGTDGSLIGQPQTCDEARSMILGFCNATHDVVTGVALLLPREDEPRAFADTAEVTFGSLSETQLQTYLATGQWRGKAGGYNLFDRQRDGWPIAVTGDETTVVGLPMARLRGALKDVGIEPEPARL